jgi:hypothetical protein
MNFGIDVTPSCVKGIGTSGGDVRPTHLDVSRYYLYFFGLEKLGVDKKKKLFLCEISK